MRLCKRYQQAVRTSRRIADPHGIYSRGKIGENRIGTITPVVDVVLQRLFPFPSSAHFNFTSSIPAIDFFFGKKLELFYFHSQRIHRTATAKRSSADIG